MKTSNGSNGNLTILMHPDEGRLIRQLIGMQYGIIGLSLVLNGNLPGYLVNTGFQHLPDKIKKILDLANPEVGGETPDTELDAGLVAIELEITEWAMCLFIIVTIVYGGVVAGSDLHLLTGYHKPKIKCVLDSLHETLEGNIRRLVGEEVVRIKRGGGVKNAQRGQ